MSAESDRRRPARGAEAARNREMLVRAAARSFATGDERIPLARIAHEAGVGIGTLYRHFPTRETLVEAVYRDEVSSLRAAAEDLLARHEPSEALAAWCEDFLDWAAVKSGMNDALRAMLDSGRLTVGGMRDQLTEVIALFVDAGIRAGEFRDGLDPTDVAATFAAILSVSNPSDRARSTRMLALVREGLRIRQ